MFFGEQGERVDIDTHGGHVGVVLEGLHQVEVATIAAGEPIMAIELNLGPSDGVDTGQGQLLRVGSTSITADTTWANIDVVGAGVVAVATASGTSTTGSTSNQILPISRHLGVITVGIGEIEPLLTVGNGAN